VIGRDLQQGGECLRRVAVTTGGWGESVADPGTAVVRPALETDSTVLNLLIFSILAPNIIIVKRIFSLHPSTINYSDNLFPTSLILQDAQ
jgi:hypothetical protein